MPYFFAELQSAYSTSPANWAIYERRETQKISEQNQAVNFAILAESRVKMKESE